MHVSIIIVHYNTYAETVECLQSLQKLTTSIDHTVVVVDNGSSEPLTLPKKLRTESVHLIRSESNLGFTGGNNMGTYHAIEQYNSDFVVYLNNDTTVDPQFLDNLLSVAQADTRVGIVCPHIYFYPGMEFHSKSYTKQQRGNVFWFAGGFIDWRQLSAGHMGVDEVDQGQFAGIRDTEFATGCCMLVRREVLEKVGTFDKRYFLYYEDADLSMRARAAGFRVVVADTAVVWHKNASSADGSGSDLQTYYQTRNRLLFFLIHGDMRVRLTVLRFSLQLLVFGTPIEKKAVWHVVSMQFGKQPLV